MELSIITINYKKPNVTTSCLSSLYAIYKEQFEKNHFEVIVVDNFSGDNSVEILEKEIKTKKYKNVHVLLHKTNNGFGGGNNFGVKYAKGNMLLFLNNDTEVKGGLKEMVAFAEDNAHIGVVGGVLKNVSGALQYSYDSFYDLPHVFALLLGMQRVGVGQVSKPMQVDWVKGACLMISKELFEKIKGFDEKIFMYTEDMELCYRVHDLGKQVWAFPGVDIIHADQGSSNRSFAIIHIYAGIMYFYKKHRSGLEQIVVKLLLQSKAYILILLGKLTGNSYLVSTYEKALSSLG